MSETAPPLRDLERDVLRVIYAWEQDPYPFASTLLLPKASEMLARLGIVFDQAQEERFEAQDLASNERHNSGVSPVPEYVLLSQFHGHPPIDPALRALVRLNLIQRARTCGITTGCWRIGDHIFELHTDHTVCDPPKTCIRAYLDKVHVYDYLGFPETIMERGWTLTAEGLRAAAALEGAGLVAFGLRSGIEHLEKHAEDVARLETECAKLERESESPQAVRRTQKRKGRKPIYDRVKDKKFYDDYRASDRTLRSFAMAHGIEYDDARRTIGRVEKRLRDAERKAQRRPKC